MNLNNVKNKLKRYFVGERVRTKHLPLAFYTTHDEIYFLYQNKKYLSQLYVGVSKDGFNFNYEKRSQTLPTDLPVSEIDFISSFVHGPHRYLFIRQAEDTHLYKAGKNLERIETLSMPRENAYVVANYLYDSKYVMFSGDRSINISVSSDLKKWHTQPLTSLTSSSPIEVAGVWERPDGILLLYIEKIVENNLTKHKAYLALLDKTNPYKLIWKTTFPVWNQNDIWESETLKYLGSLIHNEKIHAYFLIDKKFIYATIISGFLFDPSKIEKNIRLAKHFDNPIISPEGDNDWEAFNTFNPAAVQVDDKVHLLYRAQGFDYVSSVGYAISNNGLSIDYRSPTPIYNPLYDFETNKTGTVDKDLVSGGGYGGCEDPRLTRLGNKIYMTYVAFDGWSPPRLALTSILITDFLKQRWNWSRPILISRPGIIDKSGCLLPEKINDKYVFFHRIFPNIQIDYVDDLNFDGKTKFLKSQYEIPVRADKWDSRKIGTGAPPIKTKDGWLLIYYGVDDKNDSQYHIGAMLLDINKPQKVLYRCEKPILSPTEHYENNGFKPGIAYPCGAAVVGGQLLVYYGGADSYVCVATADLDTFLHELKTTRTPHMEPLKIQEVVY